jgi:dihydropteroate synthase
VGELVASGAVVVVGASRKSFIQALHDSPPEGRLGGTIAASLWAARAGVQILRVHDVAAHRQALSTEAALGAHPGDSETSRTETSPAETPRAETLRAETLHAETLRASAGGAPR